ncbi:MAG TPA: alpha/beta fold hydrolase [Acidimicrobiia bacterium]
MPRNIERPEWLDSSVWPFPIQTLHTAAGRVAFTDVGQGQSLFFLNAPQWSMVWRDVMSILQQGFRCIAMDAPGLGLSDRVTADRQHLGVVRDAVVALIDRLDLTGAALVVHDLGGLSGLAAAARRPAAFTGLAAVNTFGWAPSGILLPLMLGIFGSDPVRWLDTSTRALPVATSGRLGVGRRMDGSSRKAFRLAFDRPAVATLHRLFSDAARNSEVHSEAAQGVTLLAARPALSVFGSWGDYLRFRRVWRRLLPRLTEVSVPGGIHFPMDDDPGLVARAISSWQQSNLRPRGPDASG